MTNSCPKALVSSSSDLGSTNLGIGRDRVDLLTRQWLSRDVNRLDWFIEDGVSDDLKEGRNKRSTMTARTI